MKWWTSIAVIFAFVAIPGQLQASDVLQPQLSGHGECGEGYSAFHAIGTDAGEKIELGPTGISAIGFSGDDEVIASNPVGSCVRAGQGDDVVFGSPGPDSIFGANGADRVDGREGNDTLLSGGDGADLISGGPGNDRIEGGLSNDTLSGGPGDDRIDVGPGRNKVSAGAGADTIYAANDRKDVINCGSGRDRVFVDRIDRLSRCEIVKVARSPWIRMKSVRGKAASIFRGSFIAPEGTEPFDPAFSQYLLQLERKPHETCQIRTAGVTNDRSGFAFGDVVRIATSIATESRTDRRCRGTYVWTVVFDGDIAAPCESLVQTRLIRPDSDRCRTTIPIDRVAIRIL